MKRLYDKLEKVAGKLEKEGKPESSVKIYERLGRVKGKHLQNAVNVAYRNGLYSLGLDLCYKYFDREKQDFFKSKAIVPEENTNNIKLLKKFVEGEEREDRLPEIINKNDLEYFSTNHIIEKYPNKN